MTYREIPYIVADGEARPFRAYYSSKWWAYKTYQSMCVAIDEYIEIRASWEL
jgi:hypothetical protein